MSDKNHDKLPFGWRISNREGKLFLSKFKLACMTIPFPHICDIVSVEVGQKDDDIARDYERLKNRAWFYKDNHVHV